MPDHPHQTPTRSRAGCLIRLLVAGVTTVLLASTALLVGVAALLYELDRRPEWIARGIEWAIEWPEGSIALGDLSIDAGLRVHLRDVRIEPPKVTAPVVALESASCDLPSPWLLYEAWELGLGRVVVEGLTIEARAQRPAVYREPPEKPPLVLSADSIQLRRGSFTAPEDPPMKPVALLPIDAQFQAVRWTPRTRRIEGVGTATVGHMVLGALELHHVELPILELTGTSLLFEGSQFGYGRTVAHAAGRIDRLDQKPAVDMRVQIKGDRVETAIQTATGSPSPVLGTLSASVHLKAGGDLPRGAAHFEGWMHLTDTFLFVGPDLGALPKVLLDIAPWFQREDGGWVHIGDLRGEGRFGRGWVELQRLERPSDRHRALQAWGTLRGRDMELFVRAVPKKNPDNRPGLGLWVGGPLNGLKIRLARRDELRAAPRTFGL